MFAGFQLGERPTPKPWPRTISARTDSQALYAIWFRVRADEPVEASFVQPKTADEPDWEAPLRIAAE
jgi:hypothetical protein